MIKDTSFEKIKKYRKIGDCFDRSSLECNIAFYGAFLFCVILYVMIKNSEISSINNMFVTITKDISIALIGFFGFYSIRIGDFNRCNITKGCTKDIKS